MKHLLPNLYRTFAAAMFAGLLSAQVQFTVTPNPVVFAAVPAATQQSQTVSISSSVPTPIAIQIPDFFKPFLNISSVPAFTAGTPPTAQFTLTVDTHGLAASTVPNQFLLIVGVPGTNNQVQVPVNVIVTGPLSPLASLPSSLNFAYQTTGPIPSSQSLTITSATGSALSYSVTSTSTGNWLIPTVTSGNTATANIIPITVNPAGLAAGAYDATITVTPSSGNPLIVPVHIDVTAPAQVTISKPAISFVWQTSTGVQGLPGPQTVTLGSSLAASKLFFSLSTTFDPSDPAWLVVTPTSGFTPADVQLALNNQVVNSMSVGKHNATIFVDSPGSSPSRQIIPVSFTISNSPLLTVSPSALAFSMAATGALPPSQTISVGSTSTATPINAVFTPTTGGAWATVTVTSSTTPVSTPAQVQVSITPLAQGLPAQTYSGTVTITSATDRQDIPVTLKVSNVPILSVTPGSLTFAYQVAKSLPIDQSFQITSSGVPITFSAAVTSTGNWLTINTTPGVTLTTPASLIVSVDRTVLATLAPNTYSGNVALTQSNGQVVNLPVTLNVSQNSLILAFPSQLAFTFQPGDARVQRQNVSVTSTGDAIQFNVISAGGFWLSALGASNQMTSVNVPIQVDASQLAPGVYTGVVTIIPVGLPGSSQAPAISIPIKVTVASGALAVDKNGLSFTQVAGGSLSAAQTVNVTNAAGTPLNFSASAQTDTGGNWLTVTPANGTTPQALTISVANAANLPVGTTYTGAVILQAPGASNSPLAIRVTFTVAAQLSITIPTTPVSFSSSAGAIPPAQSLALSGSSTGMNYTATATTVSGGSWLVVSPANGTLPGPLNISIAPAVLATLAPGIYTGSVKVDSPGATNSPQTIPISLVVASSAPTVSTVRNSASYQTGAIAPGEILYIEGSGVGPGALTIANPSPAWPTNFGNVQVTFDGIPAAILYVMNNKLSVVVPWAISGRQSTQMVVTYHNQASAAVNLQVAAVAPGLYTSDASGSGQAAILNYHVNGTVDVNTSNRPIERGGAIAVYGTGGGVTTPLGLDGAVTPGALYPLMASVTAFIGGRSVPVLYSGGAPGLLSGAMQINIQIPTDTPSGPQPVVILINGVPTQANAIVNVQ